MIWRNPSPSDEKPSFDMLRSDSQQARPSRDLTPSIMGRLGYMRCHERALSRARRRRTINRLVLVAAVLTVGIGSLRVYNASDLVRQPDGLTMPGAIDADSRQQSDRMHRAIDFIRNFAPEAETSSPAAPAHDEPLAVGPMRFI
ncbi:MAG: hypothetical protein AAF432_14635 [Planctomycetota bacterium]